MRRDEVPDYMLEFKSKERDDGPENMENLPPGVSQRPEDYGRFRVGIESTSLYIMDIEDDAYVEFDACNRFNLEKVAETIEGLENYSFEESIDRAYDHSKSNKAASKLEAFAKDGDILEEDKESLNQIREDWMPYLGENIRDEMKEDIHQYREEGLNNTEIRELFSDIYSRPRDTRLIVRDYMDELDDGY